MIKLWRFLSISIVLAVCLGLALVPGVPLSNNVVSASGNVTISIQPPLTTVGFSEAFNLTVVVDNPSAMPISNADVRLSFDPTYFNVIGMSLGDMPFDMLQTWDNTTGIIKSGPYMALGTNTSATSILLVTISCESKSANGVSAVDFLYDTGPPPLKTDVFFGPIHYLEDGDMSLMYDGTVIVGVPPTFSVSPDSLTFNAIEGGESPSGQTLEVCNPGTGTLDWELTDNTGWLSETPTSGSLDEDDCEDVTVSVDVTGMEAGDYSATITITGSGEVWVPVSLHIESAAPVGPANLSASSLSISPQQVEPDEQVTVSINVANTGGETGSYNAILYINGVVEDSQSVSVAAGTSKNVIFTVSKSKAGVYDVSLAGQNGQFEVVGGDRVGDGLGTGGIIVVVVAVIVLIVGLFLIRRGTRRET